MSPDTSSTAPPTAPQRSEREEHITDTGWRVVGRAVSMVAEAAGSRTVPPGRDEDVLFAARFHLSPRIGGGSAIHGALATLGAAVARDWEGAPPLTREHPVTRPAARFHGLQWDVIGERGAWTGELVWRHPHPVVAGAPCTTHIVLTEQAHQAMLTIRVCADNGLPSVRGMVGAGQARPAFLTEMNRGLRLVFEGQDGEPGLLHDYQVDSFVRDVLLSETRDLPVAVLAPLEEGGYIVPAEELAEELLGLAHLYVIERHPTTFRLSDALGDRRLSTYWGALRAYMPDFSCADRSEDHPLLVRDRLVDPVLRADFIGRLGRFARLRVPEPAGVAHRRRMIEPAAAVEQPTPEPPARSGNAPAAAAQSYLAEAPNVPSAAADASRLVDTTHPIVASMPPLLSELGAQIRELAATISHLVEANTALADEISRLRTTTSVRAANTASLERRIGGLEEVLLRHLSPEDSGSEATADRDEADADLEAEEDSEPLTLVDVLRQAASAHPDALLILDSAERSAAESPFEDVDRVAVILDAMAGVARRRQEGAIGTSLRAAFRELGIDYRGGISTSTSERHRRQYLLHAPDGRIFDCREHIVLGTSYDPRHCLRVYFTSRAPVEARFVIGHVGRHFEVATTT